jgi:hypothetical protein
MRARYYSPYLMRFLNADPSGFSGGSNWFAYADGNPISLNDPFGLCAERNACTGGYGSGSGWSMTGSMLEYTRALGQEYPMLATIEDSLRSFVSEVEYNMPIEALGPNPTMFFEGTGLLLARGSQTANEGGGVTRVGRWMSQAENDAMVAAGRMQESTSLRGVTSVTSPPNAATWARQTEGTIFTEFNVPSEVLRGGGSKIYGPNSIFGPKLGITEMPPATNIIQTSSKWPR